MVSYLNKVFCRQKKSIDHAIVDPHFCYSSLVWTQNWNSILKKIILQKRSLWITCFQNCDNRNVNIFAILKLPNKTVLENCLLIYEHLSLFLLTIFNNWLTPSSDFNYCKTCWPNLGSLVVLHHNTIWKLYWKNSVNISSICAWNYIYTETKWKYYLSVITR